MAEGQGYRFEPLERRGLLLGLNGGQVAVVAFAVIVALGLVKARPGLGGFAAAAAALGSGVALCRPVAGRPVVAWLGVVASFVARRHPAAQAPPRLGPGRPVKLPARVAPGLYLCELPAGADRRAVGMLLDERGGTASAVLRARGGAFCLLDGAEKHRKLASWGAVLESLATHRSCLARLQWCQQALPGDSEAIVRHLHLAGDRESPAYAGQLALVEAAGHRSWQHETLLVVAVRWQGRFGRAGKEGGEVLRNEVRALRAQLRSAGFVCEAVLDAAGIAAAVGGFLAPGLRRHPGAYQWPLAFEEHWGEVRVDGSWHRTYWVAEWPRSQVGPDFLGPVLLGPGRRSFSVVMAPVPPDRAAREAESSRTAQLADSQLRAQGGFLETAQQRRQAEALEGREARLADGRGAFEFAGYVTVSAGDRASLEEASAELERVAGASRLCLRRLYGQQTEALTWSMPLGRGL